MEGVARSAKGFGDFTADVEIAKCTKSGADNHLSLRVKVLEQPDGSKKRMATIRKSVASVSHCLPARTNIRELQYQKNSL